MNPASTLDPALIAREYARNQRKAKRNALILVLPLLVFVVAVFLVPILKLMTVSVDNKVLPENLPRTLPLLKAWDRKSPPTEEAYAALVADLKQAKEVQKSGNIATRINYEYNGARSIVNRLAREAQGLQPPFKEAVIAIDPAWGELRLWQILARESESLTFSYYVAAHDLQYGDDGYSIERQSEDQRIYLNLFVRTLWMSLLITVFCFLLGLPISYLLASLPEKKSNLLMILVLLPFWTSLLVRTSSWIVLLQTQGVINDLLVWVGLIENDQRISMIYNMTGTMVAMTHILLPFMVLPMYSVMKNIPPSLMRAAMSMGGNWFYSFFRVYFPLTVPGVSAGGLLVFILAVGYFITPALVGGSSGQMISNLIAYHIKESLNWGLGTALSAMLLGSVLILYWLYNKIVGIDKLRF